MTSKFDELVKELKEIFQIDKPELDFGIYRILRARRDEITDFRVFREIKHGDENEMAENRSLSVA